MNDMDIKDVEKKLEEAAENMELRPFSERWDVIQGEINATTKTSIKRKKISVKKWLPAVAAACTVVVSAAVIIPIALKHQNNGTMHVQSGGTNTSGTETSDGDVISPDKDLAYYEIEKTYSLNGARIKYWLELGADGTYEYIITAERNGVCYYLEHPYLGEDIELFLSRVFKNI